MEHFDDLLAGIHSATITEAWVLVREVHVKVGVLSKPVRIRVYYSKNEQPYRFELSARMKTAGQQEVREGSRTASSESEALRQAVRLLTQDYEEAVRQGRMPDDSWLVDGDRF